MRAPIAAAIFVSILACEALAQTPDAIHFTLAAKDGKTTFRQREAIEVELQFTSSIPGEYGAWTLWPSRITRVADYDKFTAEPSDGVVDPLADIPAQLPGHAQAGRRRVPATLSSTPVSVGLQVNEWLSFRKPGHYRITAETTRVVTVKDEKPLTLRSNALEIDIVTPKAGWAAAELEKTVTALEVPDPPAPRIGQSFSPAVEQARRDGVAAAARTLRFLDTPEAARAMAHFYRHGPEYAEAELNAGLFASPYRKEVMAAMEAEIASPNVAVDSQYMSALIQLAKVTQFGLMAPYTAKTPEEIRKWIDEVQRPYQDKTRYLDAAYYAKLGDAVRVKQGQALAVSLQTLITPPAPPPAAATIAALLANFSSLPENSQGNLLGPEWDRIASPAIVPLVRSLAEGTSNLRDAALTRLWELDPETARRIILDRLGKLDAPGQIYGESRVLLELPEKTLPALDATLVAGLKAGRPAADVLIARYASEAAAPELEAWVEQLPARFCNGFILPAYFFRVDPKWAAATMTRLERQNPRANCLPNLSSNEDLLMSPGLEKQAIADLASSNPFTVRQAQTLLQYGGSAAAEKPLLEGLARLHDAGTDLKAVQNAGVDQGFVFALLSANRWMASEETIAKVESLCSTDFCRRRVALARSAMEQPIAIGVGDPLILAGGAVMPRGAGQIRERLAYYPKGTQFYVGGNGRGSWYFELQASPMRRILEDAGMKVVDAPSPVRR